MTFDPASGRLFILDAAGPRIVRIEPEPGGGFDNGTISEVDLRQTGLVDPRGLAFDPTTGHLHVLIPAEQKLYELSETGQIVASRDLSEFGLGHPQGMVFAPSGDSTDDPAIMNLYLADSGLVAGQIQGAGSLEGGQKVSGSTGSSRHRVYLPLIMGSSSADEGTKEEQAPAKIVELSLNQPVSPVGVAEAVQASMVQTIDTSQFSPPSPDPAGITYLDSSNTLLVSDSEVNEMPIFTGDNLFEMTLRCHP
jgi:hypothetical protein